MIIINGQDRIVNVSKEKNIQSKYGYVFRIVFGFTTDNCLFEYIFI